MRRCPPASGRRARTQARYGAGSRAGHPPAAGPAPPRCHGGCPAAGPQRVHPCRTDAVADALPGGGSRRDPGTTGNNSKREQPQAATARTWGRGPCLTRAGGRCAARGAHGCRLRCSMAPSHCQRCQGEGAARGLRHWETARARWRRWRRRWRRRVAGCRCRRSCRQAVQVLSLCLLQVAWPTQQHQHVVRSAGVLQGLLRTCRALQWICEDCQSCVSMHNVRGGGQAVLPAAAHAGRAASIAPCTQSPHAWPAPGNYRCSAQVAQPPLLVALVSPRPAPVPLQAPPRPAPHQSA